MVIKESDPSERLHDMNSEAGLTTLTAIMGFAVQVLRKEKRFTQTTLAESCGISQATISRIEMGEADVTVPQLYAICQSLEISASDFIGMADSIRATLSQRNISVLGRLPKPAELQKNVAGLSASDARPNLIPLLSMASPLSFALASVALEVIHNKFKK